MAFGKRSAFRRTGASCELLEARRMLTGTWSAVAGSFPAGAAQTGIVLTDGSIMVHGGFGEPSSTWYKLTPAANGSYASGSWSQLASSNLIRLYTATNVLTSGKVLVIGGEYSDNSGNPTDTNTGEIYDPIANTWTSITNFPQGKFGDDPSALLPNGKVLAGYLSGSQTYIYDPTANSWTQTGTKLTRIVGSTGYLDPSDEESWVTLPDGSILTYDVFSSIGSGTPHAERYIPATGLWVDAGIPPAQLSSSAEGYELGPGLLLPDGRVFYAGATQNTAYYTPSTNTWAAGPAMPNGYVMADAPGAVLPNGNLLLAGSPAAGGGVIFQTPTHIFELNTSTNVYTDVTPSSAIISTSNASYNFTFLVLPTGQIAMFNESSVVGIYAEDGSPVAAAVPVITGISYAGTTGVYTLSGTNLNGINEGAAYGDDNEMSSNYPLVRLTDSVGNVSYARTSNWSLTGVNQGAETVTFTLPAADTTGAYLIQAVANGVPSATALAVMVNANTTSNVAVQASSDPSKVNVLGGGSIKATYAIANFSSIYFVGDNAGDTLTVNLNINTSGIITTVQAGSGSDTINVNQTPSTGPVVIAPSAGNDAVNVGTVGAAVALAQFQLAQQIGVLTIGSGGKATITNTGTKKLLQANGVLTTGSGVLDLTNNDMIIHGGNLPTLSGEIASGLNTGGGLWAGPGITSSTAATNTTHLTAVGIIQNNNAGSPIYGTFDGQSSGIGDVLIKYTYFGDANLDGHVDGSDYSNIDNGFIFHLTGWFSGDFNYSGSVNGSDYTLIDDAFNTQGATISAQIAQPSALIAKVPASQGSISILTHAKGNFAVFVPQRANGSFADHRRRPKPPSQLLVTSDPLSRGDQSEL